MTLIPAHWEVIEAVGLNLGPQPARSIMDMLDDGTLTDLGPCPWPGALTDDRPKVVERSVARELQMRLGEEAA